MKEMERRKEKDIFPMKQKCIMQKLFHLKIYKHIYIHIGSEKRERDGKRRVLIIERKKESERQKERERQRERKKEKESP